MNRSLDISEDLLSKGFNVRINTCGLSRLPLIRTGDWITINPDQNRDIGDIIVFRRNDHMFGHRPSKGFEKKESNIIRLEAIHSSALMSR